MGVLRDFETSNFAKVRLKLYSTVSPIVVMTVPEKKKDWPKLQLGMFLVARVTPRWLSLVTAAM